MSGFVTRLAVWLLRSARLSNADRQLLTTTLLDRLGTLPLHAIIRNDGEGNLFVNGRPLTLQRARRLHEGAKAMLRNYARQIVTEQVRFLAIEKGVHENISPDQGLFSKAALWVIQEENKLYAQLGEEMLEDET